MFEYVRVKCASWSRIIYRVLGLSVNVRSVCHRLVCHACESLKDLIGLISLIISSYLFLAFGCAMSTTCEWPSVWGLK